MMAALPLLAKTLWKPPWLPRRQRQRHRHNWMLRLPLRCHWRRWMQLRMSRPLTTRVQGPKQEVKFSLM